MDDGADGCGELDCDMEVFLRVYAEQDPVDPSLLYYESGPGRRDSDYDLITKSTESLESSGKTENGPDSDVEHSINSLKDFRILAATFATVSHRLARDLWKGLPILRTTS